MTNPYEDHHHISVGELGFLALLGAILTLPDAMLRRVLKTPSDPDRQPCRKRRNHRRRLRRVHASGP